MKNILYITLGVFLSSLWVLIIVVFFVQPTVKTTVLSQAIYPEFMSTLRPEAETLYYRLIIMMALLGQGLSVFLLRQQLDKPTLTQWLQPRIIALAISMGLCLCCVFKIMVYQPRYQCARLGLIVLLVLTALIQLGWPYAVGLVKRFNDILESPHDRPVLRQAFYILCFILLVLMIRITDTDAVVARFFIGEQFHHNDSFVMGPALAVHHGLIPFWDVISQYGLGLGYVANQIMQWLGGLSYGHMLTMMVMITLFYYMAWFVILRHWYNSVVGAFVIVLLGMKWQMFHPGVYPLVFTYGSATVMRYFLDVIFFWMIYQYLVSQKEHWRWLAGIIPGVQLWYLHSEGVYLVLAWYAFVGLKIIHDGLVLKQRLVVNVLKGLVQMLIPVVLAAFLVFVTVGPLIAKAMFWQNVREFSQYFFSGFGVEPMTFNLKHQHFGALLMGLSLPLVYVSTIIMAIRFHNYLPTGLLAVALSVYGLGLFHYFVARSTMTSYDVVILPLAWLIGFWANIWMGQQSPRFALRARLLCLIVVIGCLFTTHQWMSYPNFFNVSKNPMTDSTVALPLSDGKPYFNHLFRDQVPMDLPSEKDFVDDNALKAYYTQASDFSADVRLIKELTPPQSKVPVISSFEIKLLMDSDRAPYFYYFPLIISRPFGLPLLAKTSIYTTDQMQKTLKQLMTDKPLYVFMEPIFATRPLSKQIQFEYQSFVILTDYVLNFYEPVSQGKYLVAYRRKQGV